MPYAPESGLAESGNKRPSGAIHDKQLTELAYSFAAKLKRRVALTR
jgi:hypothetical protein